METASASLQQFPRCQVSVVLPVKGVRAHSLENWQTHLGVSYPGKLEYIFVVESEDDPAYRKLQVQSRLKACLSWHLGINPDASDAAAVFST